MIVEVSETIARPPGEVFRMVSDVRNEPQWHTDVLDAQLSLPFPMVLMAPLVRRMVRKANKEFLANLKRVLEAG